MRKSAIVAIALAISIPLVLLGGGLAAAADQLPGLQSGPDDGMSLFTQTRDCPATVLRARDRVRSCDQDCVVGEECLAACPRVTQNQEGAFAGECDNAAVRPEGTVCFVGGAQAPNTTQSAQYDGCSRCDVEPLNEYPPTSPWYTENQ